MTLLLTHTACLDHLTPPGHPERPDRLRAVAEVLAEDRFKPLVRGEAPEGNLDSVALCHGEHYVGELRHIAPTQRHDLYRRRHLDVAGHLGSRDARRRRRGGRNRRGDVRQPSQCVRRGAPARPSCRGLQADGLLLLRQCRDRRAPRPAQIRHRPRGDRRFRRPSRQRHAGHLLVRSDRDVLLDAPDAAVSRHRRQRRARRARHHRQRAAGLGRRQRQVPRRVRKPDPAAVAEIQPGADHRSRPASTRITAIRWPRST